jgi:hypothetical protein
MSDRVLRSVGREVTVSPLEVKVPRYPQRECTKNVVCREFSLESPEKPRKRSSPEAVKTNIQPKRRKFGSSKLSPTQNSQPLTVLKCPETGGLHMLKVEIVCKIFGLKTTKALLFLLRNNKNFRLKGLSLMFVEPNEH